MSLRASRLSCRSLCVRCAHHASTESEEILDVVAVIPRQWEITVDAVWSPCKPWK